jgi:hypothetical protein
LSSRSTKKDERLWTKVVYPESLCRFYKEIGYCTILRGGVGIYYSYAVKTCWGKCSEFKAKQGECPD